MTTNAAAAPRLTPAQQDRRSDLLVIAVVLVALVIGWVVKYSFENRTTSFAIALDLTDAKLGSVTVALPSTWVGASDVPTMTLPVAFHDPNSGSTYKSALQMDMRVLEDLQPEVEPTLNKYVDRAIEGHTKDLVGYQLLKEPIDTTVAGQPAKLIEYAYVDRPIDAQQRNAIPIVVHAQDYIVLKGNHVYMLTVSSDQHLFDAEAAQLRAIVGSIQLP